MAMLAQPTLRNVGGIWCVSFALDWSTVGAVNNNQIGPITFNGAKYELNLLGISGTSSSIPAMKSLSFSESFNNTGVSFPEYQDSELLIYVPSTGQLVRVGNPLAGITSTSSSSDSVVSGVIPIVSGQPSDILFGKGVRRSADGPFGILSVSMYSEVLPPWIYGGASLQV